MARLPRDPDCTCKIALPEHHRLWCEHCRTEGPLPGSSSDPDAVEAEQEREGAEVEGATLVGSIVIEPAAAVDDLDRAPETLYVRVSRDGSAIIPGDEMPLSTLSVVREVRALIEALHGFEFNGSLIRTAASKYGSARSRIQVVDSVVSF